jgi:exopolysaccharide biosynthesis polyprenyl glycosylphosphotransferase
VPNDVSRLMRGARALLPAQRPERAPEGPSDSPASHPTSSDPTASDPLDSQPDADSASDPTSADPTSAHPLAGGRLVDRVPVALVLADLAALVVSVLALGHLNPVPSVCLVVVALAVFNGRGLHRPRLTLSLPDEIPAVLTGVALGTALAAVATGIGTRAVDLSDFLVGAVFTTAVVLAARGTTQVLIRQARRRGWASHGALVVGTDPLARRVARLMQQNPELGLRFTGFVEPSGQATQEMVDSLVGEDSARLFRHARRTGSSVVIVTPSGSSQKLLDGIRSWGPLGGPTVYVAPSLHQLMHDTAQDRIRDVALIRVRPSFGRAISWRIKAVLDRVTAAALLVLAAPVMLLVAAAVRLEGGKGVLFRQTRVGLGGEDFTLYKFRSMRPEKPGDSAKRWSIADADRLGPVGRFIRTTSLDELPQLFNILKGDMSLVGPRPERPHFVEQFSDRYDSYELRDRVRPGLTGWAAVNGLRGDTSIEERAYFDNIYIDNWTLGLDLKILVLTVLAVVRGTGS